MLARSFVYQVGDNDYQSMEFKSVDACKFCAETACQVFHKATTVFVLDTVEQKYSRYKQYSPDQTNWEYERVFEEES